jgi:HK97 family phage prohead protease
MRTLLAPFLEFKLDAGVTGRFRGYGSTFGNVDKGNDICVKGCFTRSLTEHKAENSLPSMYWMHDPAEPIGDWIDMTEDSKGLVVEGQLWVGDRSTECSKKALNLLQGTGKKGLSIGYKTKTSALDKKSGARLLQDVDLRELSVVGWGMNPSATVTSIKSLFAGGVVPTVRELEEYLRDAGLSATQAKAFLSDGYKGLARDAETQNTEAEDIKELRRLRAILRGEEPCG